MIAITKLLLSSQEVWVDELAATSDGSAMARWALLSALESALELRLTTPGAVVRLRVALPPSPDSRCAYGMYREQLHLHDGVPELPGPWQHDHTGPGFVLMHGIVDALAARLRLVLATRPNVPGTQFYWRATGAPPCSRPLFPIHSVPTRSMGLLFHLRPLLRRPVFQT